VAIAGGNAPYDIVWSNLQVGGELDGLCPGAYGFTVTDVEGCTFSDVAIVVCDTPALPCETFAIALGSVPDTDCTDSLCNGVAFAAADGGVAPYNFEWSNGNSTVEANSLCAGTYGVTVTDAAGCTLSGNITVSCNQDPCVGFSVIAETTPAGNCADSVCTGAIT
jgi:hypothetical protein